MGSVVDRNVVMWYMTDCILDPWYQIW